ncbi:tripartite tricarboxylate transporter permease [Caldimonas thermodepolymerans]|uniref:tripartite tricarboxylate transporter permease n=1 Tax=Caldimonas thermodepolymerans TaxID=215580 RepID=UPI0022359A62|nr:tripartite tricarboxylate transporter permease [Caldimonas thermodepolymerans]UZG42684.1 tripartite tricarboxylate transporter permease [Caldimonas thermodepolymerans]
MELLQHLAFGFEVALSPGNLLYCFVGVLLGTVVGVLPGLGPVATIAMLLPLTFSMEPATGVIMLAGIYYGAQYGGSTTAILLNLPGESSSVVTALDGNRMARQGRGGAALTIAALGSFFAGCVSTALIALFAPALSDFALEFGPADYFALVLFGLIASVVLAQGPVIKAVAMIVVGMLVGVVGTDISTNVPRYTFGFGELTDGIGFVAVSMGLYGIADIFVNLRHSTAAPVDAATVGPLRLTREEWRASAAPVLRGTALGSFLGILPGGGAMLASFCAYTLEKKLAADPTRFGQGAIEGVAAPEAANNAGAQTSFVPLLTLGLPSNALMAMVIGALLVQGITPGPQLLAEQPAIFWGVIASMWIGNAMLVVLNLPMVGLWVRVLTVPYRLLFPCVVLVCALGAYSVNNDVFSIYMVVLFGALGYLFYLFRCEPAPLLMGLILGPLCEEYLRRSLEMSGGDLMDIPRHPIALGFLIAAGLLLLSMVVPAWGQVRSQAFAEEGAN